MIPAVSAISFITTSNTAQYFFDNPLSSIFGGVLFGGIGGGLIEALAPLQARAFISGGILFATSVNIVGRSIGWLDSPTIQSPSIIITK